MSSNVDGRQYLGSEEIYPHLTWGCMECGALVHDLVMHNQWHDRIVPNPDTPTTEEGR